MYILLFRICKQKTQSSVEISLEIFQYLYFDFITVTNVVACWLLQCNERRKQIALIPLKKEKKYTTKNTMENYEKKVNGKEKRSKTLRLHACIHTYTFIQTHTHIHMYACRYESTLAPIPVHNSKCTYVHIYIHTHTSI